MRTAARVDDNQAEIVKTLRAVGATVQVLSAVGKGCPDLLVGFQNTNYLMEIKDGKKPPSAQNLTKDEERWHRNWRGIAFVVRNTEEALAFIGL